MAIAIGRSRFRRPPASWSERMRRRRQRMIASGFQRVLDDGLRAPRGLSARVAVQREQVIDAAWDIEAFVARLRDPRPVSEEGLARARALLTDGNGPVYTWAEPGTLRRRVRVLCEAME